MVSQRIVTEQAGRLKKLPNFPATQSPDDKMLQHELSKALLSCVSDAHLIEVVDEIIRTKKFSPMPSEIYEIVEGTAQNFREQRRPSVCQVCQGDRFVRYKVLRSWDNHHHATDERITEAQYWDLLPKMPGIGKQMVYAMSERCQCHPPSVEQETAPRRKSEPSRVDGKALAGKADW